MYKLIFFVNIEDANTVKEAVFEAGGGVIGDYDHCCFTSRGRGQFRPLPGANPYLGSSGKVEFVEEERIELVVADDKIQAVVAAMKAAHPYETPAYDVIRLEDY